MHQTTCCVAAQLLIDGNFVPSKSGKMFKTINPVVRPHYHMPLCIMHAVLPAWCKWRFPQTWLGTLATSFPMQDESVIIEMSEGDKADVDAAVAAARKAFDKGPWPRM